MIIENMQTCSPAPERTYLLLHGSFHGAWCWERFIPYIEASGGRIVAPDLIWSGNSGNPNWPFSAELESVASLKSELGAGPCTIVAHSFAGMIAGGVAEDLQIVDEIVYVDSFVPRKGETAFNLLGPLGAVIQAQASKSDDDTISPPPIEALGQFESADAAWVERQLVAIPASTHRNVCLTDAFSLSPGIRSRYILCEEFSGFYAQAERARGAGWPVSTIACGHDAMILEPEKLSSMILAHP